MVYLLLVLAVALVGCSDWYYEAADTDYFKVKEHNLRGQYPINDRTIEGNVVLFPFDKDSVFTPEKVELIQLDSSLAEVEKIQGDILKGDSVDYRIPSRTYKYPYVKIQVKGRWKYLGSKAVPLTFETICDISNVWNPNVNLMTHLEVPLVESLVADEFPFDAAKQLAMQRFTENFGFEFLKLPAETSRREFSEMAPWYKFFLFEGSDSAFVERIEDFRQDMADGVYDNSDLVEFADYIIDDWFRMDTLLKRPDSVKMNWTFVESLVEHAYGLDACDDLSIGAVHVNVKGSKYKGDSLVCDKRQNGEYVLRPLTPLDRQFGPCTAIDSSTNDIVSDRDTAYYYCLHNSFEYGSWSKAPMYLVVEKYIGPCNEDLRLVEETSAKIVTQEVRVKFGGEIYVCGHHANRWFDDGNDTLSFFFGECNEDSLWKLKKLQDSSEFVCTFDSWVPANDTLRFLSELRPCERGRDSLRSFSFDSTYYVCAEILRDKKRVYTFKDTTRAFADSIAHENYLATECANISDTVKYIVDTLAGKYYHCQNGTAGFKFYESDFSHARDYLNKQYVKTLPNCTANSDTLELITYPYFEKTQGSDMAKYYHCANVGGKYQYEALDYDHAVTLAGIADVNARYTCDAKTDTLSVVRDSAFRNYFHCEKQNGKYTFVRIDKMLADSYASYAAMDSLLPCVPSDTLQYEKDQYGFWYYCADKGGTLTHERIERDSLEKMLVKQFVAGLEPCDETLHRWRSAKYDLSYGKRYYFVCDYDEYNVFSWKRVTGVRYDLYGMMEEAKMNLEACSAEELAARGPAAEVKNGMVTDPRDGHKYRVVTVGKQTWMAENLDYYDTLAMPNLVNETACADSSVCAAGTRRYSWYGAVNVTHTSALGNLRPQLCTPVQGVCPVGWHIPSMMEWQELFDNAAKNKAGRDYGVDVRNKDDVYYAVSEVRVINDKISLFYGMDIPYDSDYYSFQKVFYSRFYSVRCVMD